MPGLPDCSGRRDVPETWFVQFWPRATGHPGDRRRFFLEHSGKGPRLLFFSAAGGQAED
jgi:hypothetical protein